MQDHFNTTNKKTWQQAYYVNDAHFDGTGPVFLCVGGKGPPLDGYADKLSPALRDLLDKAFTRDVDRRPSARALLRHEFLAGPAEPATADTTVVADPATADTTVVAEEESPEPADPAEWGDKIDVSFKV